MEDSLRQTVEAAFRAVESMNVAAVLPYFSDDVVLIDPHYPEPRMVGKAAIADGLSWAYGNMREMSFRIVHYYEAPDGQGAAVEVTTSHILRNGVPLRFPQTFVVQFRDGKIRHLRAYQPYGPCGIAGLLLGLARLARRFGR